MSSAIKQYPHLPEQIAAITNLTPQPEETGWSGDLRDQLSKWAQDMLSYCLGVALKSENLGGDDGQTMIEMASITPDASHFLRTRYV